jgi:hypothetical protein
MSFGAVVYQRGKNGAIEAIEADLFFLTHAEANLYTIQLGRVLHVGPHSLRIIESEREHNSCIWPRMKEHVEAIEDHP